MQEPPPQLSSWGAWLSGSSVDLSALRSLASDAERAKARFTEQAASVLNSPTVGLADLRDKLGSPASSLSTAGLSKTLDGLGLPFIPSLGGSSLSTSSIGIPPMSMTMPSIAGMPSITSFASFDFGVLSGTRDAGAPSADDSADCDTEGPGGQGVTSRCTCPLTPLRTPLSLPP